MQIGPGTRLAHYEISSHLGKGGMGEVWLANDTKLGRGVAIKVLPDEFVKDQDRLARFEREARVLASLEHSNIASIHGIEDVEGTKFLVMQLAEGEDLSERLQRGAIPLDEALPIARQLAEGLDAAHEKGVIHRDLKPANIKLDPDGFATILDFGLAKAMDIDEGESDITDSPTMVRAATHSGIILGTASYMSPEQARGKKVDKRADIWAFGVVLWEMLTGQRLFGGETVSDTLAAVLTREVDLDALPKQTPDSIRRMLERCLERNPKKRLRDIGEATLVIERVESGEPEPGAPDKSVAPGTSRLAIVGWSLAVVLLIALAALFLKTWKPDGPTSGMQLEVTMSGDKFLSQSLGASTVISPDGTTIAYVAGERLSLAGTARVLTGSTIPTRLHVRRLDSLVSTSLNGTEGAVSPFFSPDGEWIAFFAEGKLKKVASSGGAPLTLCDAVDSRGGSWGAEDVIVFTPSTTDGLWQVSADGGEPVQLTTLDTEAQERSHRWPSFLPDGHNVVFMGQIRGENYQDALIKVVDTRSGSVKVVHRGGSYPRVTPSGHLTWVRDGILLVAPFDLAKLETTGPPRPVIESLMSLTANEAMDDGTAQYDVSDNGLLVYRTGSTASQKSFLVWFDRDGNEAARSSRSEHYISPRISPDGRQVAMTIEGEGNADIWVWDSARDTMSRLTFNEADERQPIWSPDGQTLVFSSNRDVGQTHLYSKSSDGSGEATPFYRVDTQVRATQIQATSWSSDGATLLAHRLNVDTTWDIFAIPVEAGNAGDARVIVNSPETDIFPEVSPDGKWISYMSNESGQMQIYVRSFPNTGGRWQVSPTTGFMPRWTRDGTEIVYLEGPSRVVAVGVDTTSGTPRFGRPELLFEGPFVDRTPFPSYDVSADGERFLLMYAEEEVDMDTGNVILVTDWFERLEERAPTK